MFAIIDIETTGISPKNDKITEIAILIHDGLSVIEEYSTLINPQRSIPYNTTRITGITNEMVSQAPKFYEVAKRVLELTRNRIFVAHNAAFDFGFIKEEFKSLGYDYKRDKLCTVRLSKKLMPRRKSYSLKALCNYLNISLTNHHRALDDTRATAQLFSHLLYLKNQHPVYKGQDIVAINTGRLDKIQQYILSKIPETTGVYYLLNREEEVIYIGKSVNMRQRAIQHFNSKEQKSRRMLNELYNVRFEETGGELIALLLEMEEIRRHKPKFNRSKRRDTFPFCIDHFYDDKGILHLAITKVEDAKQPLKYYNTWLSARTQLNKWMDAHAVCPKYCGLYPYEGPCFNFQIRLCEGVCCGKMSISNYTSKIETLIANYKLPDTNYFVEEAGRTAVEKSYVWVKDGRYRGYGYAHKDVELRLDEMTEAKVVPFDYYPDMDDLIHAYVKNKKIGCQL